jgi:Cd2+/Zn2+-exporting ATPase
MNDAPALAAAEVGIAVMSGPSEGAASAADVMMINGDGVSALPFLLKVASRTQAVIKQVNRYALIN